jgi:hypothetical protein
MGRYNKAVRERKQLGVVDHLEGAEQRLGGFA